MPGVRTALALAAGLLGACVPVQEDRHEPRVEAPPPPSPFKGRWEELALFRGGCELVCPTFDIILRPSGEVLFRGVKDVEPLGIRLGRVDPVKVDAVVEHIVAAGIVDARAEYDSQVSHAVVTVVTLTLDGEPRRVRDRGRDAPAPLLDALREIDGLLPAIQWYPADPGAVSGPTGSACALVTAAARRVCDVYYAGDGTHERCEHGLELTSLAAMVINAAPPSLPTRACSLIAASPMLRPPAELPPLTIGVATCRTFLERVREQCMPDRGGTFDCHIAMSMVDPLLRDERERRAGNRDVDLGPDTDARLCKYMLERLDR